MAVECHHVACVCDDRMKILKKKFFLKIGIFFQNLEKKSLNSIKNTQGWQRLEKYLNLGGFLKSPGKLNLPWKSTGKSLKSLEMS